MNYFVFLSVCIIFALVIDNKVMAQVKDKVEYIIALINEFAKRFKLTDVQAYRYIAHYKGIDMIDEHYNIMHTLDIDEMVNSLAIYCNRQGGALI